MAGFTLNPPKLPTTTYSASPMGNFASAGGAGIPQTTAQIQQQNPGYKTPQQIQAEQQQAAQQAATRNAQEEQLRFQQLQQSQMQAQQQQLALQAQQDALNQSFMLQGFSNNPRTTTGTTMEISNLGQAASLGSAPGSRSGGGGGSGDNAALDALIAQMANRPQVQIPALPAAIAPPAPVLEDPAQSFARAKDVSGRAGRAAIAALRDLMTRRGISDSGMETEGEANILSQIAMHAPAAEHEALLRNIERQNQFGQVGYQGGINQRGQDISYLGTGLDAGITQRGQDQDALYRLLALRY